MTYNETMNVTVIPLCVLFIFGLFALCGYNMDRMSEEHEKYKTSQMSKMYTDASEKMDCPEEKIEVAAHKRGGVVYVLNACGKFITYRCPHRALCSRVPEGYVEPE